MVCQEEDLLLSSAGLDGGMFSVLIVLESCFVDSIASLESMDDGTLLWVETVLNLVLDYFIQGAYMGRSALHYKKSKNLSDGAYISTITKGASDFSTPV